MDGRSLCPRNAGKDLMVPFPKTPFAATKRTFGVSRPGVRNKMLIYFRQARTL